MWELLQDAKDEGLAQASSSRLFILHFSDPRSHWVYRKSQYYQGGMRCCLMRLLIKMLSDMLQSPQLLSHIHIWPKPKVKLGPTDSFYLAPPIPNVIATTTNPKQISLTNRDLVSLRWDCNLSVYVHYQNRSHRVWAIGTTEITMQTLWLTYYQNWSYRVCLTNSLVSLLPKSVPPSLCNRSHRYYIMP